MRTEGLILILAGLFSSTFQASASEPQVLVEEASIVLGPDQSARAFLVINNRSLLSITLTEVTSPLAKQVTLVRSNGSPLPRGAMVPAHAELYMQPGTVHIALAGIAADLSPGKTLQLSLTLGDGLTANVVAKVVADEVSLPDHHDYEH